MTTDAVRDLRPDVDADAIAVRRRFDEYRRTRDRALRNELIEEHRLVAVQLAQRFERRGEPRDDLVQVALLALLKAVERFDPDRDVAFRTFATPTIMGELKRHFRDRTWGVQVPRRTQERHLHLREASDRLSQQLARRPTLAELAHDLRCSEDHVLEALEAGAGYRSESYSAGPGPGLQLDVQFPSDEPGYDALDDRDLLDGLLRALSERDRRIVHLRFVEELTQVQIAQLMGISQMQVSRLLRRSLERLRDRNARNET